MSENSSGAERPVLFPAALTSEPAVLLADGWRIAAARAGSGVEQGYAQADYDDSAWQPVSLPHLGQASAEQDSLWYRCRFHSARLPEGEGRVLLRFGGAFYHTRAWLNGVFLGEHEGYFQPFGFDVTDRLLPESNVVAVCCRFPVEAGAFKRKTAVAGIYSDWDCRPYPSTLYPALPEPYQWTVPVGLWEVPFLRRNGPVLIESLNVFPEVERPTWPAQPDEPGAPEARLRIVARLRNLSPQSVQAELTVEVGPQGFVSEFRASTTCMVSLAGGDARRVECEVILPRPRLWSPWTHGEPWLYLARARLDYGRRLKAVRWDAIQTFGVRQVSAAFGNGRWEWVLNGRRIFPKGSNYVSDCRLDRVNLAGLDRDILLARGANLDLLRVHAHVEPPAFYRQCDARGMMVQSDFPLIWTYGYELPASEAAAFEASVQAQAEDMVDLLGSCPSIVLWSAHNEPPWTPSGSFLGHDVHEAGTNRDLDEGAAARIRILDGTRPVISASGLHDEHLYHGWYTGRWQDNDGLTPTFPTEFGVQALPNPDSPIWAGVHTEWPVAADDPTWAHAGYQSIFWARPGVGLPAQFESLAEYIAESQAYQAFYVRHVIDQWRRHKFNPTGGYAQFLFADCWPAITWSVLDYYRLPKAGYRALAEASRPVRLCLELGPGFLVERSFHLVYPTRSTLALGLHLVNDDYRLAGRARVEWWIEPRAAGRLRAASHRVLGRLTGGHATVRLPRADEPALLVRALRLPLSRDGRYTFRTQVKLDGQVVDENRLDFRVGAAGRSSHASRRVPAWLAHRVYETGSLRRNGDGFSFRLRNPAMTIVVQRLAELNVDGKALDVAHVTMICGGVSRSAASITAHVPLEVRSGESVRIVVADRPIDAGTHSLEITVEALGLGDISARVRDRVA